MRYNVLVLALAFCFLSSCKEEKKEKSISENTIEKKVSDPFFKISLAQWSLHKPILEGELDPFEFPAKAKSLGFEGVEYVNQLYTKYLNSFDDTAVGMDSLVAKLKTKTDSLNIDNVLIMVDGEGNLAAADKKERNEAVNNHKKWVDAAQALGCHAIRVNLNGASDPETWREASTQGLTDLGAYAKEKNIEVIVENHGGLSSNASLLMEAITAVKHDNVGTLPDFGNFCLEFTDPNDWSKGCEKMYDIYKGVEEMMPKAFAVSAKSYNFNEAGEETEIDYTRMLQLVKDAGYTGYIGIEYEGDLKNPEEGIELTKKLLLSAAQKLK